MSYRRNNDDWGTAFGIAVVIAGLFIVPIIFTMQIAVELKKPSEFIYVIEHEGEITDINLWETLEDVSWLFAKKTTFYNITINDIIINDSIELIFTNVNELDNAQTGDYLRLYLNLGYDIDDGWYILHIIRNGTLIINVGDPND